MCRCNDAVKQPWCDGCTPETKEQRVSRLAGEATMMRDQQPTDSPEYFTEEGRRAGLQTALNIMEGRV